MTRFISLSPVSATQLKTSQWQGSHLPVSSRDGERRIDRTKRKAGNERQERRRERGRAREIDRNVYIVTLRLVTMDVI